jgi:uncharacterized membrane protein YkoI
MRLLTTLTLLAGLAIPAARLAAQDSSQSTGMKRMVPDSLASQAKISEDSARAVALTRVPGTVQGVALKRKHGRLVYEFQIQRAGRTGLTKVGVNAANGKVVAVEREGSKRQRGARHSS